MRPVPQRKLIINFVSPRVCLDALKMTTHSARSLALYRNFLRGIRTVARGDRAKVINLRRSFNPQWRAELDNAAKTPTPDLGLRDIAERMTATLKLLESSRRLTTNLSSLSYHHYPHWLSGTANSTRLYAHTPKPIEWDPQDPLKALKLHEKRKRDREERGEGKLAELADNGLTAVRNRAESQNRVALGRWELKG
ncbi:uncharacterized protein JCM15063_003661 [Sporobolomyces koalae]|uniref:uncharacterized protein n=1 Tax=Sporobolomyces koalae TaxID=500713 RepID=UPI00318029D9